MKIHALIFLFLATGVQAQETQEAKKEPSLVELARRSREAKKNRSKAARVITNDDLKKYGNAPVSVSASKKSANTDPADSSQPDAKSPDSVQVEGSDPASAPPEGPDMAFWEAAFQEARLNLKNAVNRGLVLRLKMNNLRNAFFSEDDGGTQERIQAELQQTLEFIEKNDAEVEKAKGDIEKLQDEAQKAGLAVGTIRDLIGEPEESETILTPTTPTP